MNRINIWAAFAAVTLAGCANEEITEQSNLPVSDGGRKPIEVTTYTPRTTRYFNATEATASTLTEQGGGFSLTAATGREEYIFEEKLFYADAQGSKCSSANGEIFYWPEEGTVTFYAYAPMAQTGADGLCTLDAYNDVLYVTPDGETDVIAAYTTVDATETDGTVSLAFQHVLAQVQLNVSRNATGLPENAVFQLDSISIYAATTSTVFLDNGNISGNSSISKYFTFYNRITGMDKPIILSDNPSKVATGMLSAFGTMVPKDNPTAETSCPIAVAYSVTIGASTRQYVKRGNINLIAGYLNKINITVSSDKPISITAEVDEWREEDEPQEVTLVDAAPVDNSGVDNEGRPYIDLGLPSGTLWATYNIGTEDPEDPEDGGTFFAWGETESKDDFTDNYHFYQDGVDDKYSMSEGKNRLDPEDDAATQNWGDDWCMPSVEQAQELNDETYVTQEWTQVGEMYGLKITSKTFPENYIFLPAAGLHWPGSDIQAVGTYGYYWTNEKYPNSDSSGICYRVTDGENIGLDDTQLRISGFLIRAVRKQN